MNKKLVLIISLVLAGLFFYLASSYQNSSGEVAATLTPEQMGSVLAKALSGAESVKKNTESDSNQVVVKDKSTSRTGRKVQIVNFWASFCGPCIQELPSLIELKNKLGNALEIVFINEDSDIKERDIFLKSFPDLNTPNKFKHIYDQDGKVSRDLGVDKLPESFVLDCEGKVARVIVGAVDWKSEGVLELLAGIQKECEQTAKPVL